MNDPRQRPRARWQRWLAAALVVLACVSLLAFGCGAWANRNFLDTDRFVDRAGPLAEDPAVQRALTLRLTNELMLLVDPTSFFEEVLPERGQLLAVPLSAAVEGFVEDRVERVVASDRFADLWVSSITVAHGRATKLLRGESEVVTTEAGGVTLDLLPVVDAVLQELTAASPGILGREVDLAGVTTDDVPAVVIARLEDALGVELDDDFAQITVYDDGKLGAAQDAVALFDRLVVLLGLLTVALVAAALWISPRRRRTLLQLTVGTAVGMVLLRRIAFILEDEIAGLAPTEPGRAAVASVLSAFLDPLAVGAAWIFVGSMVIAAAALLSGSYPWAVAVRRRGAAMWSAAVSGARDDTTVAWVASHRDALLVGVALAGLAVLAVVDLGWIGLLVLAVVIAAIGLAVVRVAQAGRDQPSVSGPSPG